VLAAAATAVRRRLGRVGLAAVVLLALAGCEVRTELNVTVEEDGSGVLELALGLDEDALSRRPDVLDDLDLSDLTDTGWEVTGPAEESDGITWLRAAHRFETPDELGSLVEDVAGADGPFRDFRVTRDDESTESRYRFEGTVDFTAGAGAMAADPELAEALDAEPVELIEQRLGAAIDEMVEVQVAVRLPGSVESNAVTQASNVAVWQPSIVEREVVELQATGTVSRSARLVWIGVAVVAGFALVLYLSVRLAGRRGRRSAFLSGGPGRMDR
jgi:hypothetical protein